MRSPPFGIDNMFFFSSHDHLFDSDRKSVMVKPVSEIELSPFLAKFAVPRTGNATIAGAYCETRKVWVIDTPTGSAPIVEVADNVGDTSTITRVRAEADDTDVGPSLMLSTSTFTKVLVEGDDTDISASSLLEVTTKTDAQVESDDTTPWITTLDPLKGEIRAPVRPIH